MAQISFHNCDYKLEEKIKSVGKYFGSTSPSFSEVYKDYDKCLIEKDNEEFKFIKKLIKSLLTMIENNPKMDISFIFNDIKERIQNYKSRFTAEFKSEISIIMEHIKSLEN